jgi:hypothetical protein
MTTGTAPDLTEAVQLTVLRSTGGGQYELVGATPLTNISATPAHSIAKIPANIAVRAGDTIGLKYQTSKTMGVWSPSGGTPADDVRHWGGTYTPGSTYTPLAGDIYGGKRLNLEAVLSYTPAPSPLPAPDTTAPVLSRLKTKNVKFGINTKGAVISAKKVKKKKGTTISYTSSEAATVTFKISSVKKSAKTKKTTYKLVQSFSRTAKLGTNSFAFSGRYLAKGKKRALTPGKYRLTATPVDAAGNVGTARSVSFTIIA